MVGQRFVSLLEDHPWFEAAVVAASPRSAGRTYREAVTGRWTLTSDVPPAIADLVVRNVNEIEGIADEVDFVCSALDMEKEDIRNLEDAYAQRETPVASNNSAHRWTPDVPMLMPEINAGHVDIIETQRKRLGTRSGFVAVKPNCSIQPYVPAFEALADFGPKKHPYVPTRPFPAPERPFSRGLKWKIISSLHRRGRRKKRHGTVENLGRNSQR